MNRDDLSVISDLMDLMRKKGAQVIEHQGTKILLGPEPGSSSVGAMRGQQVGVARQMGLGGVPVAGPSETVRQMIEEANAGRELTDDEILFASSQGWPETGSQVNGSSGPQENR